MPHSSKLHRQRDGEGKGCDGGAGGLRKGEERAGSDWPPGAAGQLDPARGEAAVPEGRSYGRTTQSGASGPPASDQPREPDSGRTEKTERFTVRPKGPESGPAPKRRDRLQHPDRHCKQQVGKLRPGETEGSLRGHLTNKAC